MSVTIEEYTKDRIPDVLDFERRLWEEENVWGGEIDEPYVRAVEASFADSAFVTGPCRCWPVTAANEEAQRFYQHVPDSEAHDVGIWIDIK